MSHDYVAVQWNKNKKFYDIAIWSSVLIYILIFSVLSMLLYTGDEALAGMTIFIRAFGSLGFIMLTLILCIGPLARIDTRFLPLLYNRRHLGVSMFIVVLLHGLLVIMWYHAFGPLNPLESLFTSPGGFSSAADVAFQPLGFFALVIFFVMAATSHDYWNTNLGAPVWKAIHMSIYIAYALVITHVAFGAMQDVTTGLLPALVMGSAAIVAALHVIAAWKYSKPDLKVSNTNWIEAGNWQKIANNSATVIDISGEERVAIFRYDNNKLAAVSNVCQHQNGPLGEGCVIDGLITCPWHGFQYQPEDGCSPAPFTEKIATYEIKLKGDQILLNPIALPPGTARAVIELSNSIDINMTSEQPSNG